MAAEKKIQEPCIAIYCTLQIHMLHILPLFNAYPEITPQGQIRKFKISINFEKFNIRLIDFFLQKMVYFSSILCVYFGVKD